MIFSVLKQIKVSSKRLKGVLIRAHHEGLIVVVALDLILPELSFVSEPECRAPLTNLQIMSFNLLGLLLLALLCQLFTCSNFGATSLLLLLLSRNRLFFSSTISSKVTL